MMNISAKAFKEAIARRKRQIYYLEKKETERLQRKIELGELRNEANQAYIQSLRLYREGFSDESKKAEAKHNRIELKLKALSNEMQKNYKGSYNTDSKKRQLKLEIFGLETELANYINPIRKSQ